MDEPKNATHPLFREADASGPRTEEPNRHFKTIFDHIIDGVILADTMSRQIYLGNPAMCRMLGYSPDEIRFLSVSDLHPAESLPFVLEAFEKQVRQEQSLARELPVQRKDGSVFYADVNAFPIVLSKKRYLMGIFRDITPLRQAQRELEDYRENMARAERLASTGALSATVAHELMQPLTVVRLSLQNALAELETLACPGTVLEALEECQSATQEAVAIVARFRQHARLTAPQPSGRAEVGGTVHKTVDLLTERARTRGISLAIEGVDDLPAVNAPERNIQQICFALIDNAIQAADGEREHRLVIRGQVADGKVALWFEDDCGGMPPEILEKIFQPFFTTKPPSEGTGLGLCIVERMVSSAGGKVYVESRAGQGSTFCVLLPTH